MFIIPKVKKRKIGFLMLNDKMIRTCGVFNIAKRMVKTNHDVVGDNTKIVWKSHQRKILNIQSLNGIKILCPRHKVTDVHHLIIRI